jgi:hypothetical protein
MAANFEFHWERYALIAEIVRRFHGANHRLGKTALQKMIFLLQRSFGVDVDYTYTLYTYGPYCADVARDLDIVEGFGGAQVLYDFGFGGYEIRPGTANEEIRERSGGFLKAIAPQLDTLVSAFGSFNAKELELRSTIIYLAKPRLTRDELIQQVHDVKPHFTLPTIGNALRELETAEYVTFGATMRAGS